MASKCVSWACSAAMALNVTASLFSGFAYSSSSSACRALTSNVGCTEREARLLFGNTTGECCVPWYRLEQMPCGRVH